MLGAQAPAPCQWYFSQLGLLIDLVVKALADVLPEQAAGASYGDSMVISLSGIDHRNGRPWLDLEPTVGGWGAWDGSDGESGLINNVNGSLKDLADRGAGDEVPDAHDPLRLPPRLGRARASGAAATASSASTRSTARRRRCSSGSSARKTPGWGLFGGQRRDAARSS